MVVFMHVNECLHCYHKGGKGLSACEWKEMRGNQASEKVWKALLNASWQSLLVFADILSILEWYHFDTIHPRVEEIKSAL